jgi:hypothetical protein
MTKKKKSNYSKQKYPSFNTSYQVSNRRELLDQDYHHKLTDKEKAWLDAFNQETVIANFDHNGKKLYKSKKDQRKIYTENNKRNKDVFANSKAHNKLKYSKNPKLDSEYNSNESEDSLTSVRETLSFNTEEDAVLTRIALKKLFESGE